MLGSPGELSSTAVLLRKTVCSKLMNLAYYHGGEKILPPPPSAAVSALRGSAPLPPADPTSLKLNTVTGSATGVYCVLHCKGYLYTMQATDSG